VDEAQQRPFQLSFNSALRGEFQGARATSDGGLILVRELDERLGLSALMDRHLSDSSPEFIGKTASSAVGSPQTRNRPLPTLLGTLRTEIG